MNEIEILSSEQEFVYIRYDFSLTTLDVSSMPVSVPPLGCKGKQKWMTKG